MDQQRRKELKESYLRQRPQAGVLQLRNLEDGKLYLTGSLDLRAMENRLRAELGSGGCRIRELQQDWRRQGEAAFRFEVLDTLDPPEGQDRPVGPEELKLLERLWLDKLQPYGEQGYNRPPAAGR